MIIFFDTSSLFKLYHKEDGTDELIQLFSENRVEKIYLSEITKVEFDSVVWKKFRKQEISEEMAHKVINNFENDWKNFIFIHDNKEMKIKAKLLISKYSKEGLRTLDSIQLASALEVKDDTDSNLTADKLLMKLFKLENLKI